jgi:hypothetical protein
MSLPGFYNDDAARAYPLIPFSNVLLDPTLDPSTVIQFQPPLDTLVDFGCLVGLDAEFDNNKHVVYLHEIRRVGNTFAFDFRSNAPGLLDYALVFSRELTDTEYTTEYAEASSLPTAPEPQEPLWEGFLVTGPLESLAALLPTDGALTATTGPQIEPALVQNLGQSYLRTINLANQDRIRVTPPDGCPGSDVPVEDPGYIVYARDLAGDLRFKEGYNVAIRQSTRNNTLTFLASVGAGAGVACDEVPVYPGEQPPDGSSLLTGGPACDEVVNSINGLTSSVIRLVADLGTSIYPSLLYANTLIVDFDRHDMTVCGSIDVVIEPPPEGGGGDGGGGDGGGGEKPPPSSSGDCTPLPYSTNFATGFPPAWYVAFGSFVVEDNNAPGETGKSLASTNLSQRNIAVWNCYQTGSTEMTATIRFKMMPGAQANGGLVWEYHAQVPDLGLKPPPACVGYEGYAIWLVNVATNSLEWWSNCTAGPNAGLQLETRWYAGTGVNQLVAGDWYQITARVGKYKTYYPKENPWKFKGVLTGITKPAFTPINFGFNYGDVPTSLPANFLYATGVWGVGSFNAHCRFSLFKVEKTPLVSTS